jgi:hypothetical protein
MRPSQPLFLLSVATILAGCVASGGAQPGSDGSAKLPPLPEEVIAVAAPWQDLSTARLMPQDGCYWYEHQGQIERTMLPLRTPEGRPICTSAAG